jgi:hypothetical protein
MNTEVSMLSLVKDNIAQFDFFRDGTMFYNIVNPNGKKVAIFPIDVSDKEEIGNALFGPSHKAINLMRYIRKAKANETLFVF